MTSSNQINFINPAGLHKNPAYSQAIVVTGAVKTIYVGGQNSIDAAGAVIGKGDFKAQVEQTLKNLRLALEGGGARPEDVIKWNIYVVDGQSFQEGFEVFQRVWGKPSNPPIITGIYVAGLTNPDYLVEIDAIAVVSEQ